MPRASFADARPAPPRAARFGAPPILAVCLLAAAVAPAGGGNSAAFGASTAFVDLGVTDVSSGLEGSQRGNGTDGECDAVTTGPATDRRPARLNRGATDDDSPDGYAYFVVTAGEVKSSRRLRIRATFFDDASFASSPVTVHLHYTNAASTGPADIPDTFAGHPSVLTLSGTGFWVRRTWVVADAGFRTFQQGTSDFRFDLGGARVAVDRVEVAVDVPLPAPDEVLVGAHYYPWYTLGRWNYQDCGTGALRLELSPAQRPALGRYDSSSTSVVDQHLRWCAEYGVNVVILEFIAPGSREDLVCRNTILRHRRAGDVKFTVLYDWAIRFQAFEITPERLATARADFDHLAREYFVHPSYLKLAGEIPVAMIYVTRALSGDVEGLTGVIRDACASRGLEVFIVGDEFLFTSRPNEGKIARWDAIFGYDAYAGRGGHWGSNGNLDLYRERTGTYRAAAVGRGVKFVPSCAPGFNDRAVRRICADNPAMARRTTVSATPTSLFEEVFARTCLASIDAEFPLVSITSFNEWHEDTQIEPTAGGGATTTQDSSPSGTAYTQGVAYDDFGTAFLEVVRNATLAATGTIRGPSGPIAGAAVEVLDSGGRVVLVRTSFSTGFYTVPRLRLAVGASYTVRASAPDLPPAVSAPFRVEAARAVTGVDVTLIAGPPVSRGDCNSDAAMDISDGVSLLDFLFGGGRRPSCLEACDSNGDEESDISDAIHILSYLFLGGPAPVSPSFPACEALPGAQGCDPGNCSG